MRRRSTPARPLRDGAAGQRRRSGARGARHGSDVADARAGLRRHRLDLVPRRPVAPRHRGRAAAVSSRAPHSRWENPTRDRPQRPGHPLRRPPTCRDLVARAQDRARAAALDRRARGAARPRRRRARRRGRGLRGRRRQGRPRLDRRPRADHPARREGADRGVQRARRPRAHPQGHDQPRPHRERRAAADPPVARAAPRPRGRRAGPAGPARHRARDHRDGRPLAQRRRAGHHARQAVRHGRRRAADRRSSGSTSCSRATRCAASRARWAPRRTCSTCSTATRPSWPSWSRRVAAHLGFDHVLTSVGQVYPRSLDFDVVSALRAAGRRRRPTSPPRSG